MKSKFLCIGLLFCLSMFISATGQAEEAGQNAPPLLPDINAEPSLPLLPELQDLKGLNTPSLPPALKVEDSECPPDLITDTQAAPVLPTDGKSEQEQVQVITDPAAMPGDDISLFNHKFHVEGGGFSCTDCHNSMFKQKAGAAAASGDFTMAAFAQGKYCGTCHDGSTAFAVTDQGSCVRCHGNDMKQPK